MACDLGVTPDELVGSEALVASLDLSRYEDETFGQATVRDIVAELLKPGHDPRTEAVSEAFDPDIKELEDVAEGMVLEGVVNNITAFGAFVDVGLHESGLIHISQLSSRRVSTPAEVVRINQIVRVRVIGVDLERRRLSLSLKDV